MPVIYQNTPQNATPTSHSHAVGSRVPRDREYAQPELYRAVTKDEIASKGWSLVPSRYIEFVDRDTELDYKAALKTAGAAAADLLKRQDENSKRLAAAFKALGVKL